jgi:hypothetical protein
MKRIMNLTPSTVHGAILGLALATLSVSAQQQSAATAADDGNLRAFIELARSDIQNEKATLIAENLELTEDEAFEFWPLHREYTLEFNQLLDQRLELIRKHVARFENMSDNEARQLADEVFALEAKRLKLKRTWFKKFSKVIPAKKAAQFFQLENQLNAVWDLQLAAELPLIK